MDPSYMPRDELSTLQIPSLNFTEFFTFLVCLLYENISPMGAVILSPPLYPQCLVYRMGSINLSLLMVAKYSSKCLNP